MAIATSLQILETVAPLLYADSGVQTWLDLADQQLATSEWGDVREQAVAYLAAHMWTLVQREIAAAAGGTYGAAPGPETSRRAGDWALSFGGGSSSTGNGLSDDDEELKSTVYGRHFLRLRNSTHGSMPMLIDVSA